MVGDAGAGGRAQVEANVDAVRPQVAAEDGAAPADHPHEGEVFPVGELFRVGHMAARGQQQVAVGVGEAVEQHHAQFITKEQQMVAVKGRRARRLEQAALHPGRPAEHMLHAPGGPEGVHRAGISRIRACSSSPASSRA